MELNFRDRGIVEINNARIIFRNFAGEETQYNRKGDRNFAVVIPNKELADELVNDVNADGVGWNVKFKEPRDPEDDMFMFLKVKVKFNGRGPAIYLNTGGKLNRLDEDSVGILDEIDIINVDMDIRPFDNFVNGKPYRTAYLQSICITQDIDRFAARYAGEEFPEE